MYDDNPNSIWPVGSPLREMESTDRAMWKRIEADRQRFNDRMNAVDTSTQDIKLPASTGTGSTDEPSAFKTALKWAAGAAGLLLLL